MVLIYRTFNIKTIYLLKILSSNRKRDGFILLRIVLLFINIKKLITMNDLGVIVETIIRVTKKVD